jgi:uncharacterized membrane protein YjjP (DUF1212 family)
MTSMDNGAKPAAVEPVDVLLRFGVAMLRGGSTATATQRSMESVARALGIAAVTVSVTFETVAVSVRHGETWTTAFRAVGATAINAWRIGELERLAQAAAGLSAAGIAARLAEIESARPLYSPLPLVGAIGAASGGFAFINGGGALEVVAAGIGGGLGQASRVWLARRRLNPHAVAALSAVIAAGVYLLATALAGAAGFGSAHHAAGFISSVLFLVPGFPLIAGLFDLLQHQILAALSRIAHGIMLLLAVAFGLSIVIALGEVDISRGPAPELAYPLKLLLRAVASFVAASAFAMLFNGSGRTVVAVGFLALAANGLRLGLVDAGMMLASASFFGALLAGAVALLVDRRLGLHRLGMTVPTVIIMVPGVYAFEMIVLFNRGQMLEALQASAACGFALGGLAMGVAAARFISWRG